MKPFLKIVLLLSVCTGSPGAAQRVTSVTALRVPTKPTVQSIRAALRKSPALTRRAPPFIDTIPSSAPDMVGWTPVTNGGATGSPTLVVDEDMPGLIARGSDQTNYIADVSLAQPKVIEPTAWSKLSIGGDKVTCESGGSPKCSDRGSTANVVSVVGRNWDESYTHPLADSWSVVPWLVMSDGGGTGAAVATTRTTADHYLKWDGSTGLWSTTKQADTRFDDGYAWQKLSFFAYSDPACIGTSENAGSCLLADGAGDRLTLFGWDGATQKLTKTADLSPMPGGGGMRHGEFALVENEGRLQAFARAGNGVLYASERSSSGSFGPWKNWGGIVADGSIPSCIVWRGKPGCAIRGSDNRIYVKWTGSVAGGL